MGTAFRKTFEVSSPLALIGGGARSKIVSLRDLEAATPPRGVPLDVQHTEYVLEDYAPLLDIMSNPTSTPGQVICTLPLTVIMQKVDVVDLRKLATLHGIAVTTRHPRVAVEDALRAHACDVHCPILYAVLNPLVRAPAPGHLAIDSPSFVSSFRAIPGDALGLFMGSGHVPLPNVRSYKLTAVRKGRALQLAAQHVEIADLPLGFLAKYLTVSGMRSLGGQHGVSIPTRWSKAQCIDALQKHRCNGCESLFYDFVPEFASSSTLPRGKGTWLDSSDEPFLWETHLTIPTEAFPPKPCTMTDIARTMRAYCDDLAPDKVEQSGCTICAQLKCRSTMIQFDESSYDLTVLSNEDATRTEQSSVHDDIGPLPGPVRDTALDLICPDCHETLKRGKMPKMSLVNSLWVGEVPDCLKDLTLGECALVSRVRYNQCVVRVAKGHAKMYANVIAFEHPSKKIYDSLPISSSELSEVLSIMYTGVEPPTDGDLKRTPVLVRRDKVRSALEWLKLNHRDYADLTIDYETLGTYDLESVPIGLIRKITQDTEGNVFAAEKSVFDNEVELGTADGRCPFSVTGLTAERHGTMTTSQRKVAGLMNLKNGGQSLAVGHDPIPQSIWNNPGLYPQMFPWLFPYGYGGVGPDEHVGVIARENHVKWLLNYYDKRFQRDARFIIVVMNHNLIRQSSTGSLITMKRNNFQKAVEALEKLEPGVLWTVSERLKNGGKFFPKTPEEWRCAKLMDQVDVVSSKVDGSLARKKFQRGEIWSLINYLNAPLWFITVSPADSKHPLCIYWASHDENFRPKIRCEKERLHLISQNPVACAQFFDYIVQLFIKHICGWSSEDGNRGIFGIPEAYYGTVEEQGRKTLHLHFLLWIRGQLPLGVVRERLMSEDSAFVKELTEYIESCLVGEFLTGSKDEVAARVPRLPDYDDRGIHTIMVDESLIPEGYEDPTMTLPEAPPNTLCPDPELCRCADCREVLSWWERFKITFDDIMTRSNVHMCFGKKDKKTGKKGTESDKAADGTKARAQHATGKGCLNKDGVCTARFPRDVFMKSSVDPKSGHLNIRKQEATINDVTPVITVCHRCNTDSRCLLSGTSVKAVVGYVTDYISKGWLKTHQIFQTAYDAFSKNVDLLDGKKGDEKNGARRMILKVVNSLSSKMEIGAPMAALYLLGKPDHYTSHRFVSFYWKNYVNFVQSQWQGLMDIGEPLGDDDDTTTPVDVGIKRSHPLFGAAVEETKENVFAALGCDLDDDAAGLVKPKLEDLHEDVVTFGLDGVDDTDDVKSQVGAEVIDKTNGVDESEAMPSGPDDLGSLNGTGETIHVQRSRSAYLAKSNTDDYRYRPDAFENISLYDWVQCSLKHPISASRNPRQDLRWFRFGEDHPQRDTHAVALDAARAYEFVPNFIGPAIPRRDGSNREDYCVAMLTLFKPWRTGIDLRSADTTWERAFEDHSFTTRQEHLMENFNMRYDCYDARDDYGAIIKTMGKTVGGENADSDSDDELSDSEEMFAENGENVEDEDDPLAGVGKEYMEMRKRSNELLMSLRSAGWSATKKISSVLNLPKIMIDPSLRAAAWNNIIKVEKLRAWRRKMGGFMLAKEDNEGNVGDPSHGEVRNDAYIVSAAYLSKDYIHEDWSHVQNEIIADFALNEGQKKAFKIISNHATMVAPEQLLMHLGGMGGTGKSTVIKALSAFFKRRNEEFRFVLLGPTGTSAALIGGSTYHTYLGINTQAKKGNAAATLEDVRERMQGVGYILLDEHSMLDCRALCLISARCCDAIGYFEKPFGGINVILCGDFAQLPPVKGQTLYSRNVDMHQTARQTVYQQENTIGKHIWLQFTTVVMLTENMRQTAQDDDEVAFRRALTNLRWHACDDADIALLRSRIAVGSNDLCVDAPGFRNVSVITTYNKDKDEINATNSARFATETGQTLMDFYSTDSLRSSEPKRHDPRRKKKIYSTAKVMTRRMQDGLWNQPPSTSEQIPGKLSICIGLPVLIRYNEATDLCMTRGQEARIVGWSAQKYPKWKGRQMLDTLFVELTTPPLSVKLPHLPKNVVPLTRNANAIEAQLPDDTWVTLTRSQIAVLPNYSMTDYSAQGKTREWNVIDLAEARSFQAVYTSLSRGTSLAKTLIIRDFPEKHLRGTLSGELRQEYRELDYLATITDLLYKGVLPSGLCRATRWETIAAYRMWKSTVGGPIDVAPAFPPEDDLAPPSESIQYKIETLATKLKRKDREAKSVDGPQPKKRRVQEAIIANAGWESPYGPVWDSADWSCAFDVWTFILSALWLSDRVKWSRVLKGYSQPMATMIEGFETMRRSDPELEMTGVRNMWREAVRRLRAGEYTAGRNGVDIVGLSEDLLGYVYRGTRVRTECEGCGQRTVEEAPSALTLAPVTMMNGASSVQAYVRRCLETLHSCTFCGGNVCIRHMYSEVILIMVSSIESVELEDRIEVGDWGMYRMCGLVYFGAAHFIGRVVTPENKVYAHDGIEGGSSTYEGCIGEGIEKEDLRVMNGKRLSMVCYVLADRVSQRSRDIWESDDGAG